MLRAGNFKHAAACDALNPHIWQKFIRRSRIDTVIASAGIPTALQSAIKVLFISALQTKGEILPRKFCQSGAR